MSDTNKTKGKKGEPGVGRNFPTENILTRKAFGISTLQVQKQPAHSKLREFPVFTGKWNPQQKETADGRDKVHTDLTFSTLTVFVLPDWEVLDKKCSVVVHAYRDHLLLHAGWFPYQKCLHMRRWNSISAKISRQTCLLSMFFFNFSSFFFIHQFSADSNQGGVGIWGESPGEVEIPGQAASPSHKRRCVALFRKMFVI